MSVVSLPPYAFLRFSTTFSSYFVFFLNKCAAYATFSISDFPQFGRRCRHTLMPSSKSTIS